MIFVDSNIPMYLVGADHPNKHIARALLERLVESAEGLATDAEVLQEILHRYVAINRRDAIGPAIDALRGVVDEVYPVEEADVLAAQRLLATGQLSARDAIHVAIMQRHEVHRILSFDSGFDSLPGLTRISS
jgi:predicted nucleic acid-binding protein